MEEMSGEERAFAGCAPFLLIGYLAILLLAYFYFFPWLIC